MAFKDSDFTFIASVRCALKGVRFASRERNFRIDIVCALITIILGFVCQISAFEWLVVVACFGLVLGGEALNSALEYIVDLASPDYHVLAGKAKDCAECGLLSDVIARLHRSSSGASSSSRSCSPLSLERDHGRRTGFQIRFRYAARTT